MSQNIVFDKSDFCALRINIACPFIHFWWNSPIFLKEIVGERRHDFVAPHAVPIINIENGQPINKK